MSPPVPDAVTRAVEARREYVRLRCAVDSWVSEAQVEWPRCTESDAPIYPELAAAEAHWEEALRDLDRDLAMTADPG